MIYIGTSGFSYDDWKGHFYPEHISKKDMFAYYTSCFNTVEINSTYYLIPPARTFAPMDRKTPKDFKFVVKAHKDMTHIEKPLKTTFDSFLESIKPLNESGKLGCILAQYPWSFKYSPENIEKLTDFKSRVGDISTVIEFRNSEWLNEEVFTLLRKLNIGFCCVDEPELKGLLPRITQVTSNIGYVRFHGRNAKDWWEHEHAYQRYDYLYTEDELQEWVPKVESIQQSAETTYLFFNNHYQGKSAQNAGMFAKMLNINIPKPAVQQQIMF